MLVLIDSLDTDRIEYGFDFKDESTILKAWINCYDEIGARACTIKLDLSKISDETIHRATEKYEQIFGELIAEGF